MNKTYILQRIAEIEEKRYAGNWRGTLTESDLMWLIGELRCALKEAKDDNEEEGQGPR
jgi:hypothetical protein